MTMRMLWFSPISYRSVEIRDHRSWRQSTSHSMQSEWIIVGACICSSKKGLKTPCRMLQKEVFRKTHFKKRWFFPFIFVLRSVGTTQGQICNCCIFCTYYPKASSLFWCQLQRRNLVTGSACPSGSSRGGLVLLRPQVAILCVVRDGVAVLSYA